MKDDFSKKMAEGIAASKASLFDTSALRSAMEAAAANTAGLDKLFAAQTTYRIPDLPKIHIPTPEERDAHASSSSLVKRLSEKVRGWRKKCPEDAQPVIVACLNNGTTIMVNTIVPEGFNGITIYGLMPSGGECMVACHQNSLQLFCYIKKVENIAEKRKIGFGVDGEIKEE